MIHSRQRSFWLDDYGPYEPNDPLDKDITVDVVVVGGGFTGQSSAWNIKQADPGAKVAIIEQEVVGFGASGRNMGWVVHNFGLSLYWVWKLYGLDKAKKAARYCEEAQSWLRNHIESNNMDCDFRWPGVYWTAMGDEWLPSIDGMKALYDTIEYPGEITMLDKEQVRERLKSPIISGALYDHDVGAVDPVKLVREDKRVNMEAGVDIYEHTPAGEIKIENGKVHIWTPRGRIVADKMVMATNAFTHLLRGEPVEKFKNYQSPAFPQLIISEVLTDEQWAEIGWEDGAHIGDTMALYHCATRHQGRMIISWNYHLGMARGGEMNHEHMIVNYDATIENFRRMFPVLRNVRFVQAWGGPLSVTQDMLSHVGQTKDGRIAYGFGQWGHGVAMTHQNGRTIADMILDKKTERTDSWWVSRKPIPFAPGQLGYMMRRIGLEYFRWGDKKKIKTSSFDPVSGRLT